MKIEVFILIDTSINLKDIQFCKDLLYTGYIHAATAVLSITFQSCI